MRFASWKPVATYPTNLPAAAGFISAELEKLFSVSQFSKAVPGHVPQDFGPYSKAQIVLTNIQRIVQQVQFADRLESLGLRVTRIIEAEAHPPFQPSGSGVVISIVGMHTYRIRYDISGLLLSALASGPEGRADEIYDATNTSRRTNFMYTGRPAPRWTFDARREELLSC